MPKKTNSNENLIAGQWLGLIMVYSSPIVFIYGFIQRENDHYAIVFMSILLLVFGLIFRSMGTKYDLHRDQLKYQNKNNPWTRLGRWLYYAIAILGVVLILVYQVLIRL